MPDNRPGIATPPGVDLSAFQPTRLADRAVPVLRELIFTRHFAPGERLNEISLAEMLRISRSPIREALQTLAAEGLVQMVPGRGAYVMSYDKASVRSLGELRQALECEAARLAALRRTEAQLDELDTFLVQTRVTDRPDSDQVLEPFDLHALVLDAASNDRLAKVASDVNAQLRLARIRSGESPERASAAWHEHRAIVDAIRAQDPEAAADAMRHHLDHALSSMEEVLGYDG